MKSFVLIVATLICVTLGCREASAQCPSVGLGFNSGFGQRVIVQTPRLGLGLGFNNGLGFNTGLGFNNGVRFVQPFNSFGLGLNFGAGGCGLGFNQAVMVPRAVIQRRGLFGRRVVQRVRF